MSYDEKLPYDDDNPYGESGDSPYPVQDDNYFSNLCRPKRSGKDDQKYYREYELEQIRQKRIAIEKIEQEANLKEQQLRSSGTNHKIYTMCDHCDSGDYHLIVNTSPKTTGIFGIRGFIEFKCNKCKTIFTYYREDNDRVKSEQTVKLNFKKYKSKSDKSGLKMLKLGLGFIVSLGLSFFFRSHMFLSFLFVFVAFVLMALFYGSSIENSLIQRERR
jgi:phage FluMu protein Com